jgi:hypothetical protein
MSSNLRRFGFLLTIILFNVGCSRSEIDRSSPPRKHRVYVVREEGSFNMQSGELLESHWIIEKILNDSQSEAIIRNLSNMQLAKNSSLTANGYYLSIIVHENNRDSAELIRFSNSDDLLVQCVVYPRESIEKRLFFSEDPNSIQIPSLFKSAKMSELARSLVPGPK